MDIVKEASTASPELLRGLSSEATAAASVTSSLLARASAVVSSAAAAATEDAAASSTMPSPIFPRPSSQLAGLLIGLLQLIPRLLYWLITYTTIFLPSRLFTIFSSSLTITMNATTLLLLLFAVVSTLTWFLRYRYLNVYARLPPEPQRKQPTVEVFTDMPDGDSKRGISNYLDEFLSAIKVFGYLERPVFHELTRTMQTKKLIAGETIKLEEEQGFCLVVDGLVQIFVKSQQNSRSRDFSSEDDEEEDAANTASHQGYQLLTEVKNGAPLSSLFSILSLFTEGVKLRHDEEEDANSRPTSSAGFGRGSLTPLSEVEGFLGGPLSPSRAQIHRRVTPTDTLTSDGALPRVPPLSLDSEQPFSSTTDGPNHKKQDQHAQKSHGRQPQTVHPDIVGRAAVDTTIAIIPATAFRRLTRVYPKASSHIVQVILTRLQRVTLTTGHAYLGLTSEVLRTERLMNRYTTYDLPGMLRGMALDRLKEKFVKERQRINPAEELKGIALHNPRASARRRSSAGLRKDVVAHVRMVARTSQQHQNHVNAVIDLQSSPPTNQGRNTVSAGDLATNYIEAHRAMRQESFKSLPRVVPPASLANVPTPGLIPPVRDAFQINGQPAPDEDVLFRESIVDCMLKAIGLSNSKGAIRRTDSVEQSPRLVSYDSRRQKAIFNNAFGFMDALDPTFDAESESVTSVPASTASFGGSGNIQEELTNDVEIVFFPQGSVLVEQGERNPGLYYVIDGFLDVNVPDESIADSMSTEPDGKNYQEITKPRTSYFSTRVNDSPGISPGASHDRRRRAAAAGKSLHLIKPGGLAGYLGTISSRRSFVNVVAKTDVYVGFLPRAAIERIVDKYPIVLLTMAKRLTSLLPRIILHIDFALEWMQIDSGQALYRQGDDSDAIYIVLNGRLRSLRQDGEGSMHVVGEYGQGDSVGELEVLTESKRPGSLHAIRDTELAKIPKTLFNTLALENPEITIKISRIIASRMRDLMEKPTYEAVQERAAKPNFGLSTSTSNLRTVCVLPVTTGVPVVEFASRLHSALTQIGTPNGVTSLNQAAILNHLGRHAFSRMGKLKLSQHLADLEEKFGLVLYVADTNVNSPWTLTCINQADCILLVGLAESSPSIGEYERLLLTTKTTARKELVLLHAERYCPPGLTRRWLRNRMWINGSHHHIHMSFRNANEPVHPQTNRFGNALKHRVQILQAEIQKYTSRRVRQTPLYSADTPFKGDFHRLARRLVGRSVGLVLGGGGARGIAHVGVIRALEEAGIPIDIVGGTSIGSFVGALYAWDADLVPMYGRAKKFSGRMGSMWRFALDLTYPSASYTTGHEFNRGIFKTFGTAQIEDFWLEYYCNTTNISKSRAEIHSSGYVWRYVRASMTLAGLLPPLCDEGNMLVDGGYLDNLTVEHMKNLGADIIFAVDVGSVDDQTPQNFGDTLSGFWATFNRWNPFSSFANPPTLGEIQARLAYVSSVDALERAKRIPGCKYMRPPVEDYATLDFGRFDEICKVGYDYGKGYLEKLREQGILPVMEESDKDRELRRTMAPRRASI